MYSMNDMEPVSDVQGPVSGPVNYDLLHYMHMHDDVLVAYDSGNKYVKTSQCTVSVSWDIHR